MYQTCRHIKTNGSQCGSPAVKDKLFCYHHGRVKKLARNRRRGPNDFTYLIPFAFPEDSASIQYNQFLVMQAFNEGRIDQQAAATYTSMLRACRLTFGKTPLSQPDQENIVQRIILTPDEDEIAPPREVYEDAESPVHHKNCPCLKCAEEFRNQAAEQHHPDCQCGLCEQTGDQSSQTADHPTETIPEPAWLAVLKPPAPAAPPRFAPAQKLCAHQPATDPTSNPTNIYDYLYGDEIKKHEAQYAARCAAALEAGIDPPPYEPFDRSSEATKRLKAEQAQIEKNRQAAREAWNRRYPDEPLEEICTLSWNEQEDLRVAQAKKLREEESRSNQFALGS